MYKYQKFGKRTFRFFVEESDGFSSAGELEVFTEAGQIVDFTSDDLPGNIYDAICNAMKGTIAGLETTLQAAQILPLEK